MFVLRNCFIFLINCVLIRANEGVDLSEISKVDVTRALRNIITIEYVESLTHSLIDHIAESFVNLIQHKKIINNFERIVQKNKKNIGREQTSVTMNKNNAQALLDEPNPDGDNLDEAVPYFSDAEVKTEKPKQSKHKMLAKVNGVYYRRLLGLL